MKMESQIHLKLVDAVTKYFWNNVESSSDDDITKMVTSSLSRILAQLCEIE